MTIDELAPLAGGRGRALAAWDCFRAGVDPVLYYDPSVPDSELDRTVSELTGGLLETTREEIASHLPVKRRTEGLGRAARQSIEGLYGDLGSTIDGAIASLSKISVSSDGTTKLLVKLVSDGLEVETVIIPWEERGRSTLCISSQVGCKQGCTFCATGRMGKVRSLTSDEILAQVYHSRRVCRALKIHPVDNVVFMGMGEPADNAENVIRVAEVLAGRQLFEMAQSKVTISTVAPEPAAFGLLAQAPAALAWSVHAATDDLRKRLVPTTKHTMEELRVGFVDALLTRPRKLRTTMLEVVLIDSVNDSIAEANAMADLSLKIKEDVPGAKVVVNLIPFNDIGHPTYKKPSMEKVREYQNHLIDRGVMVYVRTTRGDEESAACGQLATSRMK